MVSELIPNKLHHLFETKYIVVCFKNIFSSKELIFYFYLDFMILTYEKVLLQISTLMPVCCILIYIIH